MPTFNSSERLTAPLNSHVGRSRDNEP